MESVYVFISAGRFRSFEEMRAYIDETYAQDGDGIASAFMREVDLSDYEPGCIEAVCSERVISVAELLKGASYSDQWLDQLNSLRQADAAICVFAPNVVRDPKSCSLEYCGEFKYRP